MNKSVEEGFHTILTDTGHRFVLYIKTTFFPTACPSA